ncbi:hypothetical protein IPJ72_02895 [Candidatus Peregrinibacteria bacterium]|nr:MAG: hypothetical protein IPJ72_02895 [Candidatus Peregrinibacteria bacterium]
MVLKQFFFNTVVALMIVVLAPFASFAQNADGPRLATSPSDCASTTENVNNSAVIVTPPNCVYLEEPIGGRIGYDLYYVGCEDEDRLCAYTLWDGGVLPSNAYGPVQAVLSFEPDKPYQGPFGLLYNYLSLVYNYLSGLIVGLSVLFVVVGGVQMTTSAGDTGRFDAGKDRIVKSIVGLILWFLASLILYTINPTFFTF